MGSDMMRLVTAVLLIADRIDYRFRYHFLKFNRPW
jgi:hypothetical protein